MSVLRLMPRRILLLGLLGLALLLPFVTWSQAALGALLAVLLIACLLPQLDLDLGKNLTGPPLSRVGPASVDPSTGLVLYPVSALALILIFHHHLDIVAAAWALMALGDGAANIAGQALTSRSLPWNPAKTVAGFGAFVAVGVPSALALALWTNPALPAGRAFCISALAALLGAAVESTPVALDDNLTVPVATAGFVFCAWLTARSALDSNLPYLGIRLMVAVAVNLTFAVLALRLRAATRSGAALGFVLGVLVYLAWGWKSFLILLAFFLLASAATRLGYAQKRARGIAEHHGGARGWREALANVGPGAFFALMVITTHHERAFLTAFTAAFAEAAGDTVSSEIGQWLAADAYLIPSFRRVRAGDNGAVSGVGSGAGLIAAGLIVGLAWGLGLVSAGGACLALVTAAAGNLADSLLGSTIERQRLVTNGVVNFTATALAGALALALTLR
ncbi:MAG TPA: DUF92 domain-containing protein [Terriglobia bacterium]|nr:DUF92 domain-containing protein [Terriglobia bacterium]